MSAPKPKVVDRPNMQKKPARIITVEAYEFMEAQLAEAELRATNAERDVQAYRILNSGLMRRAQEQADDLRSMQATLAGVLSCFGGMVIDPARQAAMDVQTAMADTAVPAQEVSTSMTTAALGAGDFAAATGRAEEWMGRTVEHTTALKSDLAEMGSKVHKLKIQPELVNIPNLIMMLVPALAQAVASNGGASPGTSQRDSLSGLVDRGRDR